MSVLVMRPSTTATRAARMRSRRNAEVADAFFDDPVVGGADGPDFAAGGVEIGDEALHLRKDVGMDLGAEEGGGGAAELGLLEAGVELHHLSADGEFGDVAGAIEAVAGIDPVGGIAGDESGFDGPEHEAVAGVAAPEGAVAVEDGDAGRQREDGAVEVGWRTDVQVESGSSVLLLP